MREVEYTRGDGCKFRVLLPDDAPDSHAPLGIVIGPPELDSLELPPSMLVRLHNALYARRLFTRQDAKKRRHDILGALQSVLALDVDRVVNLYQED